MSGTIRSAPAGGYEFPAKQLYRRQVWNALANGVFEKPSKHVLVLPSIEGTEIDHVLDRGFRQEHVHVVDRNPAIVATLKRRYPNVNTYGVTLDRAVARIVGSGRRIAAANIDLCGPLSDSLMATLRNMASSALFEDGARVAVTMLRGREHGEWADAIRRQIETLSMRARPSPVWQSRLTMSDNARISNAWSALRGMVDGRPQYIPIAFNAATYRSTAGNQMMLWAAFALGFMADVQVRQFPEAR